MKNKIARKITTYLVLSLVYLILTEVILSAFDPEQVFVKSYDDQMLFTMYPNKKGIVISEEYKVSVQTNEFGGRQNLAFENYPILLMGDSFSEGWGVEESETFTSVANKLLSEEMQIRNMGVHGSCPSLMYIHLQKYITLFKPKKVFLQLFDNDLDDIEKFEPFMNLHEGRPSPKKPVFARMAGTYLYNQVKESSIFRLLKRATKFIKGGVEPILYFKEGREPKISQLSHQESLVKYGTLLPLGEEISKKYNGQFEFYLKPSEKQWKTRLEKELHYLNLIYNLLKDQQIELGIIYIPAKEFFAKGGILGLEKNQSIKNLESINPHFQNITKFCDTNKISCLNTTSLLWDKKPEDLYFPYDAHWNRKGHETFGKIFALEIQKSFPLK
ncbi:SGNH/GDSL hydrolase family protein [Leptospira ognonensis]|uniref:SGNH/GDSL hydrolase family protein n=1 Tax=Leptospira ognonensis TaxID=2484945 RepID=A0A4R9JTW6_9LEPT|nr:SGNH/GDSL hydrolase family protein [Leptospira ognonensis]TGL56223.1 SGNH/GDSL hydrolase family protein [Leptospira ognonensis]